MESTPRFGITNLWLSSSLFAVYLKVRGCPSFNVTFENVNVALSPFAVELYAESVTNVKVTPSTVVLNFVFFSMVTDVGLFVGVREIETFATAPLLDLGVYPRALAWDTIEFLKTAESRNISFATMFR